MEQALDYLPQAQAAKERQQQTLATAKRAKVSEPRVSSTDPEARVMKMPDGGFRPAYNVQLATDQAQGVIMGVSVVREGTDAGQHPKDYLMDGGFATKEAIPAEWAYDALALEHPPALEATVIMTSEPFLGAQTAAIVAIARPAASVPSAAVHHPPACRCDTSWG